MYTMIIDNIINSGSIGTMALASNRESQQTDKCDADNKQIT